LDGLTLTDAARDLAWLIDASHTDSQRAIVYGASYGTAWAQRYLQLRPEQPAAVILDSTMTVGTDTADSDEHFDAQARTVLARCAADATCAAKLGGDPVAKATEAIAAVKAGTCKLPATMPAALSQYFGSVVSTTSLELSLLPASIYRVLRCNAQDLDWLAKVWAYLMWRGALPAGNSDVVWVNITLSEFWLTHATADELKTAEDSMLAMTNVWWFARQAETWPSYSLDEYSGKWPSSQVPTLVLQGGLDPITPHADVVAMHYSGKNQYFVQLPDSGHHLSAPTASALSDFAARGCGFQIMKSFLTDPGKAPDTSCIADVAPITFSAPPPEWLGVVGIADLWENP